MKELKSKNFKKEIIDERKGLYHLMMNEFMDRFIEKHPKLIKNEETFKLTSSKTHSSSISEYDPDYSIKFKVRKRVYAYIIFEFIDKQSNYKTVTDLFRTLLIENCMEVIFIVNEKEKHAETEKILDVLMSKLRSLFGLMLGKKVSKEDILGYANLHIPLVMSDEKIEKSLFDEINKTTKLEKRKKG